MVGLPRFRGLDAKGGDAEGPPGRSPCCDPNNPTIVCNGTPVADHSMLGWVGEAPNTFLLTPDGVATHVARLDLRRYEWGPVNDGCAKREIGPLAPGGYAIAIELLPIEDERPDPPTLRVPFTIEKQRCLRARTLRRA